MSSSLHLLHLHNSGIKTAKLACFKHTMASQNISSSAQRYTVINPLMIEEAVRDALNEDLGCVADITNQATIPAHAMATGLIASRQLGVVAGMAFAHVAFTLMDPHLKFEIRVGDGGAVSPSAEVARIYGPARALLSDERVAFNYLGRLSGIASLTAKFAAVIAHTKAKIADTRKTTPGLRAFEKYAMRCGGSMNHRLVCMMLYSLKTIILLWLAD